MQIRVPNMRHFDSKVFEARRFRTRRFRTCTVDPQLATRCHVNSEHADSELDWIGFQFQSLMIAGLEAGRTGALTAVGRL
jgi:hypothetical protein